MLLARHILLTLLGILANGQGWSLEMRCPSTVPEGEPFLVEIRGGGTGDDLVLRWLDREIRPQVDVSEEGFVAEVLLGVGMKEKLEQDSYTLEVEVGGDILRKLILREDKAYPEQHLEVEKKYNELSEEDLVRHNGEKKATRAALSTVSGKRGWTLPLFRPVPGPKTGDFGRRRFFNGEPKSPHSGADFRAAVGDSVFACAAGRVILTGNHYFAGNSVYLDHGEGVISMYFHLDEILVEEGRAIRRGELLGKAGSTGRVTGPHLHWGLSLQGQLVDPLLLVGS